MAWKQKTVLNKLFCYVTIYDDSLVLMDQQFRVGIASEKDLDT